MQSPSPIGDQTQRFQGGRGRRAVALIVLAATAVVAAGGLYLRLGSPPASSYKPVDRDSIAASAVDYDFVTSTTGWALLTAPTTRPPGTAQFEVFRTVDGARHWHRQLTGVTSADIPSAHSIQFLDPMNGFLLIGGPPIQVFRTTDGGVRWLPLSSLPQIDVTLQSLSNPANAVSELTFTDFSHGWLLFGGQTPGSPFVPDAPPPRLFATSDGGHSWRALPDPPSDLGDPAFRNLTEAWTGGISVRPFVYTSLDGATTWQRRYLPSPPGQTWGGSPGASVLLATNVDVLPHAGAVATVIDLGERYSFITADRGNTWTYVPPPPGPVTYIDSQHWWAVDGSSLMKSADSGESWAVATTALPSSLVGLTALDSDHAWATEIVVGGYGLVTTNDGGLHWNRMSVPNPSSP